MNERKEWKENEWKAGKMWILCIENFTKGLERKVTCGQVRNIK